MPKSPGPEPRQPTRLEIEAAWVRPGRPSRTARNAQGREIWFERILWSYMPVHWEGIVYPLPIIFAASLAGLLLSKLGMAFTAIPILAAWALVMWLCKRHSGPRS